MYQDKWKQREHLSVISRHMAWAADFMARQHAEIFLLGCFGVSAKSKFNWGEGAELAIDWLWDPTSRTNWIFVMSISFRGTFRSIWDLTGKIAILVQSALLWISQPFFQNQSMAVVEITPTASQLIKPGKIQSAECRLRSRVREARG